MTAARPTFDMKKDPALIYQFLIKNRRAVAPASLVAGGLFIGISMIFPTPELFMEAETLPLQDFVGLLMKVLGLYLGLLPFLTAGVSLVVFDVLKHGRYRPRYYMDRIWERLLPLIAVTLVNAVVVGLLMVLAFGIPGYIAWFLLMFAPLLVLVEGRGVFDSLKGSVKLAARNFLGLVGLSILLFVPVVFISVALFVLTAGLGQPLLLFVMVLAWLVVQIAVSAALHTFTYLRLSTGG